MRPGYVTINLHFDNQKALLSSIKVAQLKGTLKFINTYVSSDKRNDCSFFPYMRFLTLNSCFRVVH